MNELPIIFIHSGNKKFLKYALNQAKYFNKKSNIILIGDSPKDVNQNYCHFYSIENHKSSLHLLKNLYFHFSTNSYDFEFDCIARWFILFDFMKQNKINWACYLDSDFMLYSSVQDYFNKFILNKHYEAAFCIPLQDHNQFRWTASGHVSFVSLEFLEKFCDYILRIYQTNKNIFQSKIKHHNENNLPGGICDMTLLYLYYRAYSENIFNLLTISDDKVFDHNINMSSNYLPFEFIKKGQYKKIFYKQNKPYGLTVNRVRINFLGIHFQGDSKKHMIYNYYNKMTLFNYLISCLILTIKHKFLRVFKYL